MASPSTLLTGLAVLVSSLNSASPTNLDWHRVRVAADEITAGLSGVAETDVIASTVAVPTPMCPWVATYIAEQAAGWKRKGYLVA